MIVESRSDWKLARTESRLCPRAEPLFKAWTIYCMESLRSPSDELRSLIIFIALSRLLEVFWRISLSLVLTAAPYLFCRDSRLSVVVWIFSLILSSLSEVGRMLSRSFRMVSNSVIWLEI